MESEHNSCHFWLGIESDYDEAEWQAHVRRGLEASRITDKPPGPEQRVIASPGKIGELLPG